MWKYARHFFWLSLGALLLSGCGDGPTVKVTVQATDPQGGVLHYRWKSTDGRIKDVDAPSTTWTLPAGGGLHFAYVLVSNGKGGYTERRVAVSTDTIGTKNLPSIPRDFDAPASAASTLISYKGVVRAGKYLDANGNGQGVYVPDAWVYLQDRLTGQVTSTVKSDLRGTYTVPDARPGALYDRYCKATEGQPFSLCTEAPEEFVTRAREAVNDNFSGSAFLPEAADRRGYAGRILLADGQPCGIDNDFFAVSSAARVTLLDGGDQVLEGPYRVNVFGHYSLSTNANARSVLIECEGASAIKIPVSATPDVTPYTIISDSAAPQVVTMSATLNGSEVGIFLPPPSGLPSDALPDSKFFLAALGVDNKISACQYYLAIGAVKSCDAKGTPAGGIVFDDWKRKMGMDPYARNGQHDVTATYVNRVDLNLTRRHHSITYGPNKIAAYVCNHLGPADDSQAAINTAIDNAVKGKNLVACVAMDHGVTPGVNDNLPFTRFFTFGPSGELLLSVNLDGRGEKFVPGTCVACHGGDRYAGKFPDNGVGRADIGAHFLPYDQGNFDFSTAAGLTEADQQQPIYQLNQNLLNGAAGNQAVQELIHGWYATAATVFDKDYLPASWQSASADEKSFYQHVYARSCRTCHVAMIESLNLDHHENMADPPAYASINMEGAITRIRISSCGDGSNSFSRLFSMPNSLRTLNLYYASAGTAIDQPAIMSRVVGGDIPCSAPAGVFPGL